MIDELAVLLASETEPPAKRRKINPQFGGNNIDTVYAGPSSDVNFSNQPTTEPLPSSSVQTSSGNLHNSSGSLLNTPTTDTDSVNMSNEFVDKQNTVDNGKVPSNESLPDNNGILPYQIKVKKRRYNKQFQNDLIWYIVISRLCKLI